MLGRARGTIEEHGGNDVSRSQETVLHGCCWPRAGKELLGIGSRSDAADEARRRGTHRAWRKRARARRGRREIGGRGTRRVVERRLL